MINHCPKNLQNDSPRSNVTCSHVLTSSLDIRFAIQKPNIYLSSRSQVSVSYTKWRRLSFLKGERKVIPSKSTGELYLSELKLLDPLSSRSSLMIPFTLDRRIEDNVAALLSEIITGESPSRFLDRAKQDWDRNNGFRRTNITAEWDSFHLEEPG